jgi:glycine betaine/proline transport system substrate-binding protein
MDNNPAAATLFAEASIPLGDIFEQNNLMNEGEDSQDDIDSHAMDWIADNRAQVDTWLAAARAAAQ